ncbi:hypothetical protein [Fictibacillus barbaricus]|uniref:hypothetical protein n=2 Tax=Fictibacillus barbaricus TaxID=182136 RepID=UPI003B8452B6
MSSCSQMEYSSGWLLFFSITQWHYLMAASVMVLLPVVLIFFFFQKYFIEGSNITSGTKG